MLIINPKGNALHGGPTIRCDDNIKMHLKERRCESVDCFHFGQDTIQWLAFVNTVTNHLSTPNITDNVRHASLDECAVHEMRDKLEISSDGGVSGRNKRKRACGGAYRGSAFGRSLESSGLSCAGAGDRSLASVVMKMFPDLIYFKNEFYQFCTYLQFHLQR
jgi:hypothetical protein